MGMKTKEVGGGPATGLANDFVNFLQQGLQTGSFGAGTAAQRFNGNDPVGNTMGIAGVLNDLLMGGAGKAGGSMAEMINRDTERQAQALRARFGASGGGSYGSSAAFGEALLRSESAPKLTQAIGGLQMQALSQLLPVLAGMSQKGITQRETVAQQNPWATAAQALLPAIGTAVGAFGGPAGAAAGGQIGAGIGNAVGGGGAKMSSSSFVGPQMPEINPQMLQFLMSMGV